MGRHEGRRRNSIGAIIVKIASRCNLNCSYCYLYNHEDTSYRGQPKFMSLETFDAVLARALEHCEASGADEQITLVLHGGEPTLIGAATIGTMCRMAEERLGKRLHAIGMQTNATLITDDLIEVVQRHGVRLGVSLDGHPATHDGQRVFRNGRGSYDVTIAGVERLRAAGIEPRILCVIQPGEDGAAIYRHFRSLDIRSIDFLLPDVSHDNVERFYGRHGERPVAAYLAPAFDAWLSEDDPDVHVRLFNGLIKAVMGGDVANDAFGNPLMSYLIVETNGDIEALDALKVCSDGITKTDLNVHRDSFAEIEASGSVLGRAMFDGFDLCAACDACSEKAVCGGGYLPHRFAKSNGFDNPSVWCADIKQLVAHVRNAVGAYA